MEQASASESAMFENWRFEPEAQDLVEHLGRPCLRLENGIATHPKRERPRRRTRVRHRVHAGPRLRGSIGWHDSVYLPLVEGPNDLVMAVSEAFGGWGVQAKLEDLDGVALG